MYSRTGGDGRISEEGGDLRIQAVDVAMPGVVHLLDY